MNATSVGEFEGAAASKRRIWIEDIHPQVDGGQFDAKRALGDRVDVTCDLVADGHDLLAGELRFRMAGQPWQRQPLRRTAGGLYTGSFLVDALGRYEFELEGWIDRYGTWRDKTAKKLAAGQDVSLDLQEGAQLLGAAASRATGGSQNALREASQRLVEREPALERFQNLDPSADALARAHADRSAATTSAIYGISVDPALAGFSSWYELFPRSAGKPGTHGTFRDVEAQLDDLRAMGFTVLYLPPIHPIGRSFRKGRNNAERAEPEDPGSPWAIGAAEGGHTAIHPQLGTLQDFRRLVTQARDRGISLALDIAFQASPDHPWVKEHPSWFVHRPDGSIQYAENPPKKYQDVYPFDFESRERKALWEALRDIFLYWAQQGVRVFRVDNPHTKPLPFWQWCLAEVKRQVPEAIFLAEAFTRPGLMYALAKVGFSQSYTYFTWRQTSAELGAYLLELTRPPLSDLFRPNFWPNTPDILPEHLQFGGRAAFIARLVLAGTMSSNFGIYGPVFELQEGTARPSSEEYDRSEKYEIRSFDRASPNSLRELVARLNRCRREHPALQHNHGIAIHPSDNPMLFAFSKHAPEGEDVVLTVVNLDPHGTQRATLQLDLEALGVSATEPFLAHDELSDQRYLWTGASQKLVLDPGLLPAVILHVRGHHRSERDFDYYA